MKRLNILIILVLSFSCSTAQVLDQLFLELNMGRYTSPVGLFESTYYPYNFSYLNGFNFGYHYSEKQDYFIGFRRFDDQIEVGDGFTVEQMRSKGMELSIGVKYNTKNEHRFFLSYGVEVFGFFSKLKGTYWIDSPPSYEVNHLKTTIGIAPSLTVNFRLTNRIGLFANTRAKVGRGSLERVVDVSAQPNYVIYPNRLFWSILYEPIHSIGLSFNL